MNEGIISTPLGLRGKHAFAEELMIARDIELVKYFFFSSRRRHTRSCDWSSDVCSSDRSEEHTSELQSHDNLVCRIIRSEEHTSELQSHDNLVCRLLLEKKKKLCSPRGPSMLARSILGIGGPGCLRPCLHRPLTSSPPRRSQETDPDFWLFFFNDRRTPDFPTFSQPGALPI